MNQSHMNSIATERTLEHGSDLQPLAEFSHQGKELDLLMVAVYHKKRRAPPEDVIASLADITH